MAAERPQTTRAPNPASALSPVLGNPYAAWLGVSASLTQEARALNQGTQDHLRRFAELQLATAHKALAAQHPTALAELSSQWTAASIDLASAEARRQGEAMTRLMGAFWPAAPRA